MPHLLTVVLKWMILDPFPRTVHSSGPNPLAKILPENGRGNETVVTSEFLLHATLAVHTDSWIKRKKGEGNGKMMHDMTCHLSFYFRGLSFSPFASFIIQQKVTEKRKRKEGRKERRREIEKERVVWVECSERWVSTVSSGQNLLNSLVSIISSC